MTATSGEEISALFAAYAEHEGLLGTITEQECARLAKAFMAGYTHGLYGNAERTGDEALDAVAAKTRKWLTGQLPGKPLTTTGGRGEPGEH